MYWPIATTSSRVSGIMISMANAAIRQSVQYVPITMGWMMQAVQRPLRVRSRRQRNERDCPLSASSGLQDLLIGDYFPLDPSRSGQSRDAWGLSLRAVPEMETERNKPPLDSTLFRDLSTKKS
jgi:hypothetical protein